MVCHLRWPLDAVAGLMAIRPMEQSLPTHNRASGCNFYNLALTTNVVQSATWGYADVSPIQSQPWSGCRPCCRENSRPVRTPVSESGRGPWVTLRSPTAKSSLSLGSRPVRTPIATVIFYVLHHKGREHRDKRHSGFTRHIFRIHYNGRPS